MVNKARRLLIRLGKAMPFVLCFIVLVSYIENLYALITNNIVEYGGYTILNTPISFAIGERFEYDWIFIIVTFIISVAIETCCWNRYACIYLALQLGEKSYLTFELEPCAICVIAITNILVSGFFVYKGIKIILT